MGTVSAVSNGALKETFVEKIDDDDEFSEQKSLLSSENNGSSIDAGKLRRCVQWNDSIGNKLAEILIFEPSEASDNEEDDPDSCVCIVM